MAAVIETEKRRSIRISAGRSARVYFQDGNNETSLHTDIIDISTTGCRFILKRQSLPFDVKNINEKHFLIKTNLDPGSEVEFEAEVMWNQIFHSEFLIIGGRFASLDKLNRDRVERFIMNRQKAGLELFTEDTETNDYSEMKVLEEALEVECISQKVQTPHPYRFALHRISKNSMELIYAPKEYEAIIKPEIGDTLEVTVYPPSWSDAELRALRFIGKVADSGETGALIDFGFSDHDIQQMIFNLIPAKRDTKAEKEANYYYVLVLLAIIILWLLAKS